MSLACECNAFHADADAVYGAGETLFEASEILTEATSFAASHAFLLLATAMHHTPSLHPFDYLVWLLRAINVLFLAAEVLRSVHFLDSTTFC